MAKQPSRQEQVSELKRWIATLKESYKDQLRKDLGPLKMRLAKLEAKSRRKRR